MLSTTMQRRFFLKTMLGVAAALAAPALIHADEAMAQPLAAPTAGAPVTADSEADLPAAEAKESWWYRRRYHWRRRFYRRRFYYRPRYFVRRRRWWW